MESGLTRHLHRAGVDVIEVDRPNRQKRRRSGKSDPLDAVEAARAALSGRASGRPKSRDGAVEAVRVLVVAKRSARQARTKALIEMRHLGYSAPEQLRCRIKGLSVPALVAEGAKVRPTRSPDPVTAATKASLSSLAHRIQALDRELAELDETDRVAPRRDRPQLLDLFGVGPHTAAAVVTAAGDNPERLRSEAAWAHLCGVAPIPKGSGKNSGRVKAHDGGTARPTAPMAHRDGAHRLRSRDPPLLRSTGQGGQDHTRGHPHLEALRRPRGLSLLASRREPGLGVWLSPYCRPPGLTFQRFADPKLGPPSQNV